jgi:hypothetical protein
MSIGGTLSAGRSADGSALSVVDHWASDSARAYIYDAGTLRRLDLGSRILSVDLTQSALREGTPVSTWSDRKAHEFIIPFKAIPTKRRWCASISAIG